MAATRLNFEQWRTLVQQSPGRVADQFLAHLQTLSKIERQTWFAAALDRARLLGNLAERMVTEFSR
jgi:hypothetical protein